MHGTDRVPMHSLVRKHLLGSNMFNKSKFILSFSSFHQWQCVYKIEYPKGQNFELKSDEVEEDLDSVGIFSFLLFLLTDGQTDRDHLEIRCSH